MRVEQAYPGEALRHLRGCQDPSRPLAMVYCTTGEVVEPGTYHCTFCGWALRLRRQTSLPLCSTCEGSEFIAETSDEPTAAVRRPSSWLDSQLVDVRDY